MTIGSEIVLQGDLDRKSLGLGRCIKHHGVDIPLRLIVQIQDNVFPSLGRMPPKRRCGFNELG